MDEPMMEHDSHSAYQRAEQVKQRYEAEILARANVVGIGVGLRSRDGVYTDEVALIVLVSKKVVRTDLPPEHVLPSELEGVPVDVQEVGDIKSHE